MSTSPKISLPPLSKKYNFISQTFKKRECVYYSASKLGIDKGEERCCCGHKKQVHYTPCSRLQTPLVWNIADHTQLMETDAYGTIDFMVGQHPSKAQFVRLTFETEPAHIMHLFQHVWRIKGPNLVITVHGCYDETQLKAKLARVFNSGLMKAVKTTGAWVITSGLNSACIVRRVAKALKEAGQVRSRRSIVSIAISPWGLVKKRNLLRGKQDGPIAYFPQAISPHGLDAALNSWHSYFLLADNGTKNRHGAEIFLRKRLEEYILTHCKENSGGNTPVVCLVLDGGAMTLRTILDYTFQMPPVPVVICSDGDRLSNAIGSLQRLMSSTNILEQYKMSMISTIKTTFRCKPEEATLIYDEIMLLLSNKYSSNLINCFEIGEDVSNDLDHGILTALLKCHHQNHMEQLTLALTWNRPDIARSDIFIHGKEWTEKFLFKAMLEALKHDRVDFVRLLIENGVQMDKFLTVRMLENLYNTDNGPVNTLSYVVGDVTHTGVDYKYQLPHIGLVLEKLMGGTFKAQYSCPEFQKKYYVSLLESEMESKIRLGYVKNGDYEEHQHDFKYPFSELFIWAVLTKRHKMALCMLQHGEHALTKALVAIRLNKFLSYEATDDSLDEEIIEDYQKYAKEFRHLSIGLLEQCYRTDRDFTVRLLTSELENWGRQTNLSLAFIAFHKEFLAHSCCQSLLSNLWQGGMCIRRYAFIKIIVALLFPAVILALDFKSSEELMLQPQRADEIKIFDLEALPTDSSILAQHMDDNSESEISIKGKLKGVSISPHHRSGKSDKLGAVPTTLKGGSHKSWSKSKIRHSNCAGQMTRSTYSVSCAFGHTERPLSPMKKFYEFFVAPVTAFYIWTIAYFFFLGTFSVTVLTKLQPWPDWKECYMMAYVVTLAMENFRRICITQGRTFMLKLSIYFSKLWNLVYSAAILVFFVAMGLRFCDDYIAYALLVYTCDSVFWFIILLDIFGVDFQIGVYVIMLKKMMGYMSRLILILGTVMVSFGVVREAIQSKKTTWDWLMLRNIFYKPYFMLYGEVYAEEIDRCNDRNENCEYGHWIPPVYMAIFMLVSIIVIVNLMIAVFNYIFHEINAKSQEIWRFYRYSMVLDYEYKPFLPPPFIALYFVYYILKLLISCKTQNQRIEEPLKIFLTPESIEAVQDFEETCMEEFQLSKEFAKEISMDEKIKRTSDRVEYLSMKQDDFGARLQMIDKGLNEILKCQKKAYPHFYTKDDFEPRTDTATTQR